MVLFAVEGEAAEVLHAGCFADQHAEERIQAWADACPALVNGGAPMLSLGREIATHHGHLIDNLFIDGNGTVVAAEMKRGRSPRDVVAQVVDYAAFINRLTWPDLDRLCRKRHGKPLEAAFSEVFGRPLAMQGTPAHRAVILAESYDPRATDAALYLITTGVPLLLLEFSYYTLGDRAALDVRPVLGELPDQPGEAGPADSATETHNAWILAALADHLPGIADKQGWPLRFRLNKLTLPFSPADWPLALGDCQFRADLYRRTAVSLRFAIRRDAAPDIRAFLEANAAQWSDRFPARFENPPYPTTFLYLTLNQPLPAEGDHAAVADLARSLEAMTETLVPLVGTYLAQRLLARPME